VSAPSSQRAPSRPLRRVGGSPLEGNNGHAWDEVEHLVADEDPDTALCGIDQTNVPWDQGFPICEACRVIADGRTS
jgi:hypothetical protein